MDVLFYDSFDYGPLREKIERTITFLKAGDFRAADVKKMPNQGYYRAKLDDTNRLLFTIGKYRGRKYIFVLETILNHDYARCRFLSGVNVDESRLQEVHHPTETDGHLADVAYVNPAATKFHMLDKLLSFDDAQQAILRLPVPLIVIGPAGSGKTALVLEKLKALTGTVLYTSLSPFLIENAQRLYSAFGYDNPGQSVEFRSFRDYLESVEASDGSEPTFGAFKEWVSRHKQGYKISDTHKLYEEFRGVITGSAIDRAYLTADDYLALGIRQSIFAKQERTAIHDLFMKYLYWLQSEGYTDPNLEAFRLRDQIAPRYDYVVVDEVQDLTNIQLHAILKSLHKPENFLLCGDAHQIVHPNFFSWAQLKTLFYQQEVSSEIIRMLATNYRNTPEVTGIANRLLRIKNARFGSIDKESTYLVDANAAHGGRVELLPNTAEVTADLNSKTRQSAKFAVLVLRNEDKAEARKHFQTPLLFAIHEAKGLEYENIILFDMVSGQGSTFREIARGVDPTDLEAEALHFSRAKDKADRSLDKYKFYINALYVGMTRAIRNLFIVESNARHELLRLLGLANIQQHTSLTSQSSNQDEWQEEARKLELQGKQEQADAIREQILKIHPTNWEVITPERYLQLREEALDPTRFNKKAKDRLFTYAVYYRLREPLAKLAELKYRPAGRWEQDEQAVLRRIFQPYVTDNLRAVMPTFERYGIDFRYEFNVTPLLVAVHFGAVAITEYLLGRGAKTDEVDNRGLNALQGILKLARKDPALRERLLNRFYPRLKASPLRIRVERQLVKLESHQAEYLMVQYMIATLHEQLSEGTRYDHHAERQARPAFQAQDFLDFFAGLSESVAPLHHTTRAYVSGILSKNEINRTDRQNKGLFLRIQHGYYVPHPNMELPIAGGWKNSYDLVDFEGIYRLEDRFNRGWLKVIQDFRRYGEENPDENVKREVRVGR